MLMFRLEVRVVIILDDYLHVVQNDLYLSVRIRASRVNNCVFTPVDGAVYVNQLKLR